MSNETQNAKSSIIPESSSSSCNGTKSIAKEKLTSATGNPSDARACAACKHQRRRCAPDCFLAPYFPADNIKQFLNCHRLYGLRNMIKVLKYMNPPEKDIAIKTMIVEANMRAKDPAGGCHRMIQELQKKIDESKAELDLVMNQLAVCRTQALLHNQIQEKFTSPVNGEENGSSADDTLNAYDALQFTVSNDFVVGTSEDIIESCGDFKPLIDPFAVDGDIAARMGDVKLPILDVKVPISENCVPKVERKLVQPKQENNLKDDASLFPPKKSK